MKNNINVISDINTLFTFDTSMRIIILDYIIDRVSEKMFKLLLNLRKYFILIKNLVHLRYIKVFYLRFLVINNSRVCQIWLQKIKALTCLNQQNFYIDNTHTDIFCGIVNFLLHKMMILKYSEHPHNKQFFHISLFVHF